LGIRPGAVKETHATAFIETERFQRKLRKQPCVAQRISTYTSQTLAVCAELTGYNDPLMQKLPFLCYGKRVLWFEERVARNHNACVLKQHRAFQFLPNGNPDFNLESAERYFAPISTCLENFAKRHNLFVDKYYHESESWNLRFAHPKGGNASINVGRLSKREVSVSSVWHVDDYDSFTRSVHRREIKPIAIDPDDLREALREELLAILDVEPGMWTEVADGYKAYWSRYTKEEFEALPPHYSQPTVVD
jgi:hypothetical protein